MSSWVSDDQVSVVLQQGQLKVTLGLFVGVLLVVGDDGFGNGLANSEDLVGGTTTSHTDTDVDVLELVGAENKDWLVDLHSERCWLNKMDWLAVDSDETLAFSAMSNRGGVLFLSKCLNRFLFTHFRYSFKGENPI